MAKGSRSRPAKRPRVLAILDREAGGLGNLVAAGPGSWIDELLAITGGENVLAGSGVRYPKVSMEEVLRGRPDVILDLSFAARLCRTPVMLKNGRVLSSGPTETMLTPERVRALYDVDVDVIRHGASGFAIVPALPRP